MRNTASLLAVSANLLVLATLLLPALVSGATTDPADAEYKALVNRITAGDLSVDFRALRRACANASDCDSRGDSKDLIALRQAAQQKRHKDVVKIGGRLIAAGFPNIEAHAACATAYAALGKSQDAEFHRQVTASLLRSIFGTGDGKTKETAFEVFGTHEEYIVLMALGLPPFGKQSVSLGKPHSYDIQEVEDPRTGKSVVLYFNIDAFYPMKGLR